MNPDSRHPHMRHIVERLTEHHRRVQAEREESTLEEAIDGATFDLSADIAHPTSGPAESAYDIDTDLGIDLRSTKQ